MRLLLRLDDGAGMLQDLSIELADDATVGELSDELAAVVGLAPGTSVVAAAGMPELDRADRVAGRGPRVGATVRLVPVPVEGHRTGPLPVASPVRLVPVGAPHRSPGLDPPTGSPGRAPRTDAPVGRWSDLTLEYGIHDLDGARLEVTDRVELCATGAVVPTVNGERVLGSRRLCSGDLVGVGAIAALVRIDGALHPPPAMGPRQPHRITVADVEAPEAHRVDLPAPPGEVRLPGFPVLSATVPLLMGVALWVATRSAATAFFVLFSFVFVVASGLESRRESRAEQRFRLREWRLELDDVVARVEQLHRDEQAHWDVVAPAPEVIRRLATTHDRRVWERSASGGTASPLLIRLGTARRAAVVTTTVPEHGRRDLRLELERRAEELAVVHAACVVDLDDAVALALVGPDERCTGVARAVVAQLATLVPPDELRIEVLAGDERRHLWRWSSWLPHTATTQRTARTLVVVDAADELDVAAALRRLDDPGVRLLWLATGRAGLPRGVGVVAELAERGAGRLWWQGRPVAPLCDLDAEDLVADEAEPLARALAPLVPWRSPVRLDHRHGDGVEVGEAPPDAVPLAAVVADRRLLDDPAVVLEQWGEARRSPSLGAPIGRASSGVVHLDLRQDGPHALVAGTTGAGKSELLRTLVTSLALHHPPDRLTFLLVDYKGGAAFGRVAELPHAVGMITDLSPPLARRALIALRAEVRHREACLAALGCSDLADASPAAAGEAGGDLPPALVVVVDEFATLARELPAFVDGLVDVAQRGRSLGVHLVLATQRPAGVVTDAIRANTGVRIALRVADEDDSRDVVDRPDAAHLPRGAPGRGVVRTGPGRLAIAQFAWSSASSTLGPRVRSWPLGEPEPRPTDDGATSQLDLVVDTLRAASERSGYPAPRRPWVEPLPELVRLDELVRSPVPRDGADDRDGAGAHAAGLAIGWTDRPDRQRREALELDLRRDGGGLVLGASGAGRSTTLMTIAAAVAQDRSLSVRVHAIDADGGLEALRSAVGVGDVVPAGDAERVLRLLRGVADELGSPASAPRRLLLVDGLASFDELHARVNRGEAMDLLTRIARDGHRAGVHVVVAAQRRAEVPPALAASLGWRLALRSPNPDEAMMLGLDPSTAAPETPPGRGHLAGTEVQIAWPLPLRPSSAPAADPIGVLPLRVRRRELPRRHVAPEPDHTAGFGRVVCGVDGDHLGAAALDLRHHHGLVGGPPRSGRTTTLTTIAEAAAEQGVAVWRLGAHSSTDGPRSAAFASAASSAASSAGGGRPTLVAVDDLPELLLAVPEVEAELDQLFELGRTAPLRLVLSGEIDALTRCYSDVLTKVRSGRTGILLRPDPDLHGTLLHTRLPTRDELPDAAGRGWLVHPHGVAPIQVALPD